MKKFTHIFMLKRWTKKRRSDECAAAKNPQRNGTKKNEYGRFTGNTVSNRKPVVTVVSWNGNPGLFGKWKSDYDHERRHRGNDGVYQPVFLICL